LPVELILFSLPYHDAIPSFAEQFTQNNKNKTINFILIAGLDVDIFFD
jgi:hypothetical protein